jgi:hypothetical protein
VRALNIIDLRFCLKLKSSDGSPASGSRWAARAPGTIGFTMALSET